MQEIILKIKYFERGLSKSLEIVNFIVSFEPSPLKWTRLWKLKRAFVSDVLPHQVYGV